MAADPKLANATLKSFDLDQTCPSSMATDPKLSNATLKSFELD